ncbi:hairy-related 1 isoform X1 [Mastacembelus armatus]|uniref:hairy-related 1 isoform X1 n=1 Tax=Mastacembelus armatus TaxID=205130 RepID=UPI000E45FC07|nr:transcription factor HES-7-like isoform X1 [Mastacembelus armatus]
MMKCLSLMFHFQRLQNPKIEKAEILDLTVEYLQKLTDKKNFSNDSTNSQVKTLDVVANLHRPESSAYPLFTIESAGFQQCMAQLSSYMHKISPAQRTSLIEGLKHHIETQQLKADFKLNMTGPDTPDAASVDTICTSERKDDSSKLLFPSSSPFQPHSCSTPCHDYLSSPPSPWYSPSFSTYALSSSFPSFASHFSFPPSLSPPSSNTSFSFSPTLSHAGQSSFYFPPLTTLRSPSHPVLRDGSPPNSSSAMWRPWI